MSDFWGHFERPGYNPYDHPGSDAGELLAAMERAWKACTNAPAPAFIRPSPVFWDAYYNWLASPDRGHEFEPYGPS